MSCDICLSLSLLSVIISWSIHVALDGIILFFFKYIPVYIWTSPMAQKVNNLSAMQKTQVQSLGQEDPWEKKMATHSSILAWRILWTEEPGGLQSMGSQRVQHD